MLYVDIEEVDFSVASPLRHFLGIWTPTIEKSLSSAVAVYLGIPYPGKPQENLDVPGPPTFGPFEYECGKLDVRLQQLD